MKIEVSMGEIFDKMSILQLKLEYIDIEHRRKEVQREMAEFSSINTPPEYNILLDINRQIWNLTDIIKQEGLDTQQYAQTARSIMDLNQQRFRVKNMINNTFENSLKEQKSYKSSHVVLVVTDLWKAVPAARYLLTLYDTISFEGDTHAIEKIFTSTACESGARLVDTDVSVPKVFQLEPITYVSGGLLGDFIHQLSVVYEKSTETGRKARLYMSDTVGDRFRLGIEHTYKDIFPIISKLPYIESFEIHNGQSCEINLSSWRSVSNLYSKSWQDIYSIFNVNWGANAWIYNCIFKPEFENTVLISTSQTRFNTKMDWELFIKNLPSPVVFLENSNTNDYNHFSTTTGITLPKYTARDFSDLVNTIYSCKRFIGTLSMPLAIADALKKERTAIVVPENADTQIAIKTNSCFYPI